MGLVLAFIEPPEVIDLPVPGTCLRACLPCWHRQADRHKQAVQARLRIALAVELYHDFHRRPLS